MLHLHATDPRPDPKADRSYPEMTELGRPPEDNLLNPPEASV